MSPTSRREYVLATRLRYAQAPRAAKPQILDEFCATIGCHRKYAIQVLNGPPPARPTYDTPVLTALAAIWEAAGYPWAVRLKALLPLWLPLAYLLGLRTVGSQTG